MSKWNQRLLQSAQFHLTVLRDFNPSVILLLLLHTEKVIKLWYTRTCVSSWYEIKLKLINFYHLAHQRVYRRNTPKAV